MSQQNKTVILMELSMRSVANRPRDALIFFCAAMLRLYEDIVSGLGFLVLQGC